MFIVQALQVHKRRAVRAPDMMYSCMSAYCIFAKKLAEDCNMNYDYKDKILPFFGMYVFD